jgi:maleate isomerase
VVAAMEAETGIPIYDTVATGVWKGMQLADADPRRVRHWGRLFQDLD